MANNVLARIRSNRLSGKYTKRNRRRENVGTHDENRNYGNEIRKMYEEQENMNNTTAKQC